MVRRFRLFSLVLVTIGFWPTVSLAYIGPGAGLSAIGTLVALVGAVLLAIVGFVWYPVKRMMKKRKTKQNSALVEKQDASLEQK